jgi:hypothetical protein
MAPKFVFFDSNTWIYLANGFDIFSNNYLELHFKVFEILEKRVSDGSLIIFTNEIIKQEWARHQDDAATQIGLIKSKAKSYKDQLRTIGAFIGQNKEQIDLLTKAVDEETEKKIALHVRHIERVKKFIEERTEPIAVSDKHRIEATQMAQRKQAPFRGDKSNSMSDALILLSITDFLDTSKKIEHAAVQYALQEDGAIESYFITSNFGDFAALPDKHTIHPDLAPILARSGTAYYPSLVPLINNLEKEFLTQDELRAIEAADRSIHCQVCDSEYPSVQFSNPTRLFDPFKGNNSNDPSQLLLFNDIPVYDSEEPFSEVEIAYCDHCGADFITCPNCDEMVHIKENEKIQCTGCHYKFLLHVERDRKGTIHGYEHIIVRDFTCNDCGEDFDEVDENGLCETCADYKNIAEAQ